MFKKKKANGGKEQVPPLPPLTNVPVWGSFLSLFCTFLFQMTETWKSWTHFISRTFHYIS